MRKVSKQVIGAFLAGKSKKVDNTWTNGQVLRLHGSVIAWRDRNKILISTCGYHTQTTKERLNALLELMRNTCEYKMNIYKISQIDFSFVYMEPSGNIKPFEDGIIAGELTSLSQTVGF